jgi:hypothetical protein
VTASAERWELIWRACEESVARLLGVDERELAPVVELRPPVEDEPEEPS